eukprot:jgi/Mesen1/7719/ME000407S06944
MATSKSNMVSSNAFAGNPLIPAKRDHLTSEGLVELLAEAEQNGAGAKVLPLLRGQPLITVEKEKSDYKWRLAWQKLEDVGVNRKPLDSVAHSGDHGSSEGYDKLVYIGESGSAPCFAIDVAGEGEKVDGESTGKNDTKDMSQKYTSSLGASTAFADVRTLMVATEWKNGDAMAELAIAGHARALLEWHKQAQFCGRCGHRTAPIEAGNRRKCIAEGCQTKLYPRIDPVVIMLVIDEQRDLVLLGRQARFLPRMWSCLAGFIEPGESLEEAVRRETREEAGIDVGDVVYHSSQPWPVGSGSMSCQLMVGFFAFAKTTDIVVDKKELADAQWKSREEIRKAITFDEYEVNQKVALAKLSALCHDGASASDWASPSNQPKAPVYVPGPYAIAHNLIYAWLNHGSNVLRSKV